MERFERAAREFLAGWPSRRLVTGALVCGSHLTGHPTPRSDVDRRLTATMLTTGRVLFDEAGGPAAQPIDPATAWA